MAAGVVRLGQPGGYIEKEKLVLLMCMALSGKRTATTLVATAAFAGFTASDHVENYKCNDGSKNQQYNHSSHINTPSVF